jgi:hypothetical protein
MMHRATAQALPSSLTRRGRSGERPGQSRGLEDTGLNDWLTCEAVQPLRAALEDLVEIGEVVKGPPDRPTTWPSFNGGRWSARWKL